MPDLARMAGSASHSDSRNRADRVVGCVVVVVVVVVVVPSSLFVGISLL